MALTTPPRSGLYCPDDCIPYPYTDVASYVPRDYPWMYPALLAPIAFVLLVVCIPSVAPARRQQFSLAGMCLAMVAAGILVLDYGLQLSVVQPSLLAGESSGLSLLSQYNPHGVFIGLENIGYGLLALALVLLRIPLTKVLSRNARVAGWIFTFGGTLTLLLLVLLAALYRDRLDVRFEVFALLLSHLVLATSGNLVGIAFSPWRAQESHLATSAPVKRELTHREGDPRARPD
ncbi:hypothetical protein [Arthrobacter sp. BF1]|uniref:hypothetical protein n=1 Tax=Arthrobacter sp. BF1 TaxID=2821145 RepID=UPI001C4FCAA7|nr:hypothetical protein [Arthrobacter sp. BF1]